MGEGATGLTPGPRGTVRAVDTGGANGRLRELGDEITLVRERLDLLVDELDRRRHHTLDWRRQLRRHARGIALGTLTVALVAGAVAVARSGRVSARSWRRRFRPD